MSDQQKTRTVLMDTAFGNHDIDCFVTKHQSTVDNAEIWVAHNLTKNEFILITAGGGADLKNLTVEEAKTIMDDGHKLIWKHNKDVGTTSYGENGKVDFYPYLPKKTT